MGPSRLWWLGLVLAAVVDATSPSLGQQQILVPSLREASDALFKAERGGDWTALVQAQDALWPAVEALRPLLGGTAEVGAARRRLASTLGSPSIGLPISRAMALLSQYSARMLQLEALDVEQSISNALKEALGIPVNESTLLQTEAATHTLQDVMSAVALQSLGTGAQLMQAGGQRLAQRLAALNATTAAAQLRDASTNWQSMAQSLINQVGSAMAAPSITGRRLQDQQQRRQWGPAAAAERLRALAERLQQLRTDRASLRARLHEVLGHVGSHRQLRQAIEPETAGTNLTNLDDAATEASTPEVPSDDAPEINRAWPEWEEAFSDAPIWQDEWRVPDDGGSGAAVIIEELGLVPAASQLLLTDVLFLVRDAIDLALGEESPTPSWAAAYGYHSGRSPFFPLPGSLLLEAQGSAETGQTLAMSLEQSAATLPGRRLNQVLVTPPLPASEPPAHSLRSSGGDDEYSQDDPPYDDTYDAAYYDQGDEQDYAQLDDWLFDDPDDLYLMMVQLIDSKTAASGITSNSDATAAPEQVPSLPVFAVWTGSSRTAVVPSSNGASAQAAEQGQPLELLVAPFSVAARTPVPRSEEKPGLKFDARYLGAVASAAFLGLLLLAGLVAGLVRWPRRGAIADEDESLLYSHIPGTYSPPKVAAVSATTPWAGGQGSASAIRAATMPIPKKLSNLPA